LVPRPLPSPSRAPAPIREVLWPLQRRLVARLKQRRTLAAALMMLGIAVVFFTLAIAYAFDQQVAGGVAADVEGVVAVTTGNQQAMLMVQKFAMNAHWIIFL